MIFSIEMGFFDIKMMSEAHFFLHFDGFLEYYNYRYYRYVKGALMIPENVAKFRPGACTEIKNIGGNYYVYMYESVLLESGKWGKKTGKSIGKIIPDTGFIPNRNYHLFEGEGGKDDITILEYGQYALIEAVAGDVKKLLEKYFNLEKAAQIFSYASIFLANGFTHKDQVGVYYEQSWLQIQYSGYSFHMGRTAINTLLDTLGRRGTRVLEYENNAISMADRMAIDGHAIRSCSDENDLGEAGYKFSSLKEDQVNLLMGYDISSGSPVFSRMFRGSTRDKAAVKELCEVLSISGILLVVDRGFYSADNLKMFSDNGNTYIIPVPSNTSVFTKAMARIEYEGEFCYSSGKKHSRIQYMEVKLNEIESVYVFRDIDENSRTIYNYRHCIELGKDGYTEKELEVKREFFGVYVLQTNSGLNPMEVFCAYKTRWGIGTFYQYIKNVADFNDLKEQDYVRQQGLAFIMLIAGQLYSRLNNKVKELHNNTISVQDVLNMARFLKMDRKGDVWTCRNKRKKDLEVLEKLGFTPISTYKEKA